MKKQRKVYLISVRHNDKPDVLAFETRVARDNAYTSLLKQALIERQAGNEIVITKGETWTEAGPMPKVERPESETLH